MRSKPGQRFDMAELAAHPTTIYVGLPVDKVQTHGLWLRLILSMAIRPISRAKRRPALLVLFLMDEFGTIGKLAVVQNAYGLLAGLNVRLWAFLQDLSQLQRDYPESLNAFLNKNSLLQVLNARDPVSSKYFSDFLGTYTYYDGNSRGLRPVMFPEEIRPQLGSANELYDCDQLVIYPGNRVHMVRQAPYYTDPRWRPYYRPIPVIRPISISSSPPATNRALEQNQRKKAAPPFPSGSENRAAICSEDTCCSALQRKKTS